MYKLSKNITYYIIIIIIIFLFIIIFYNYHINEICIQRIEDFALSPNYCESVDGTFIYITNPNDKRCAKSNIHKNNNFYPSGKGNCSINNTFGIFVNKVCTSFKTLFPSLELSGLESSGLESSGLESSGLNENRELSTLKKKMSCESAKKLPNSSPCFEFFDVAKNQSEFEFFDNSKCSSKQLKKINLSNSSNSINVDSNCKTNDPSFGFYYPQCPTDNTVTYACRKYYHSINNNVSHNGTYQPNLYMYTPMKTLPDGKKVINQTGCFPKDLDFNQICKSANKKNQLFGAYKILIGQDGNCYNKDGTENKNEANALCSTNFNNQLPKYFSHAPLYSTINT